MCGWGSCCLCLNCSCPLIDSAVRPRATIIRVEDSEVPVTTWCSE